MQALASDQNQQFLLQIALLSQRNLLGRPVPRDRGSGTGAALGLSQAGCSIKSLPERLLVQAAMTATLINPANAPAAAPPSEVMRDIDMPVEPAFLAVMTAKYWRPVPRVLTVSFIESTPADLRRRIMSHLNAWARRTCISFEHTTGIGSVRISRSTPGYWSYLGTDILHVPPSQPTMSLSRFTMSEEEPEFRRVVRHEAGHTLGFPHEHLRRQIVARIDPEKAYRYFALTQHWDRKTVDAQVLKPLEDQSIMGGPPDTKSLMTYPLPGSITWDGLPIEGGTDITETDYRVASKLYPPQLKHEVNLHPDKIFQGLGARVPIGAAASMAPVPMVSTGPVGQWDESEDVRVEVDAEE